MRLVAAVLLLLLILPSADAQTLRPGWSKITADGHRGVVWAPSGVSKKKPHPVFVALHGMGGKAENYGRVMQRYLGKRRWIVLAPQGQGRGQAWGAEKLGWLGKMIDALGKRTAIDRSRIYLNGHSAGCAFALYLLGEYPKTFAAVAGTAGYYPGANEAGLRKAKDTPVWLGVGKRDGNHAHLARSAAQMRRFGIKVTTYAPNIGHTISAEEMKRMFAWLDGKQRADKAKQAASKKTDPKPPKKELTFLEKEAEADKQLARAIALEGEGKLVAAYDALERLIKELPKTSAAEKAAKRLSALKARPAVKRALATREKAAREAAAKKLYDKAQAFWRNNQPDKAKAALKEIVDKYGDTSYAARSREQMEDH